MWCTSNSKQEAGSRKQHLVELGFVCSPTLLARLVQLLCLALGLGHVNLCRLISVALHTGHKQALKVPARLRHQVLLEVARVHCR